MATAGEIPPERDVKDFRYQGLCRFQISNEPSPLEPKSPQLLAASSKYGLVFVGTNKGFKVIKTTELSRIDREHVKDRTKVIIKDTPYQATVELPAPPSYMALSSDDLSLAVAVQTSDLSQVYFYDTRCFAQQTTHVNPYIKVRLSSELEDLAWNPENPIMLACVMVDGSIQILEVGTNLNIKATAQGQATCVCWSPKGKQLVVGQVNGTLAQYDQALVKKKEWVCPDILQGQQRVVGLIWLSTFSFMVAYLATDADVSDQPNVVLITGGKDVATTYTPFEDPCFGSGEDRKKKYFFSFIPKWEIITATSSTAIEVAIIGKHLDIKTDLERWNLDDAARAEIPLTADHMEAYSMGVAIDFSNQMPIPISEERNLPPCPMLFVLSSEGILTPFYMVYTHPETQAVTTPPEILTSDGARQGTPVPNIASGDQSKPSAIPSGPSFQFAAAASSASKVPTGSSFSFSTEPKTTGPEPGTQTSTPVGTSLGFTAVSKAPASSGTGSMAFSGSSFSFSLPKSSTPSIDTSTKPAFGKPGDISFGGGPSTADSSKGSLTPKSTLFGAPPSNATQLGRPLTDAEPVQSNKSNTPVSGIFSLGSSTNSASGTPSFNFAKTSTIVAPVKPTGPEINKAPQSKAVSGQQILPANTVPAESPGSYFTSKGATVPQTPQTMVPVAKPEPTKQVTVQPSPQPSLQQNNKQEDGISDNLDTTFACSIIEEMGHFEDELKKFRVKALSNKVTVGDFKEMETIKRMTEDITQFYDEVKKVTKEQNKEVEDIKSQVLDSFSMAEECRMREQRNTDPKYIHLLQSKTLDPANQERLRSLQQKYQILDRGLRDCDTILDNQWQEYQNKNNKFTRISTPTTDLIYRSIKSNKNVILHQQHGLDDLESQLKQLRLYNRTSTWKDTLNESRSAELSSLADSLLETKTAPLPCSTTRTSEQISPQKMAKLKEHLIRRSVPRIKSTRPENLSMSRIVSIERDMSRRSPATVLKTESTQPNVQSTTLQQQTEKLNVQSTTVQNQAGKTSVQLTSLPHQSEKPSFQSTSLQHQAENLTGNSLIFQKRPPAKLAFSQPGMPGLEINQPLRSAVTGGFSALKPALSSIPVSNNGYEDITPPSSTGYEEDDETETETNDEDYGEGFGPQYNMVSQDQTSESDTEAISLGKNITSTPLSSLRPNTSKPGVGQTSRNLFGSSKPLDASLGPSSQPFSFNSSTKEASGFAFGSSTSGDTTLTSLLSGPSVKTSNQPVAPKTTSGGAIPKTSSGSQLFGAPTSGSSFSFTASNSSNPGGFKFGQTLGTDSSANPTGFNFNNKAPSKDDATNSDVGLSGNKSSGSVSSTNVDAILSTKVTEKIAKGNGTRDEEVTTDQSNEQASRFSAPRNLFGSKTTGPTSSSTDNEQTSSSSKNLFGKQETKSGAPTTSNESVSTPPKTCSTPNGSEVPPGVTYNASSNSTPGNNVINMSGSTSFGQRSSTNETGAIPSSGAPSGQATSDGQSSTVSSSSQPSDGKSKTSENLFLQKPSTTGGLFGQGSSLSCKSETIVTTTGQMATTSVGSEETNVSSSAGLTVQKTVSGTAGLFGQTVATSGASGLFGQSTTTSGSGGLFGQSTAKSGSSSLFGQSSNTSGAVGFGHSTNTSGEVGFGQSTNTSGAVGFGQSTNTSGAVGFGQSTNTSGAVGFGQSTNTSGAGGFGQSTNTSGAGGFGQSATTSGAGGFGQSTTTSGSGGLFGQSITTSGTGGLFGQSTTTSGAGGLFGQSAATSGAGGFGQATTTSGSSGLFGQSTNTSGAGGLFGQSTNTSGAGGFGQATTTSGSSGLFGQSTNTSGAGGLFGQSTNTSGAGGFGQATTTSGSSGLFGQSTNTSGSGGLFGQSTATSGSSGLFGSSTATSGSFGSSSFGQVSTGGGLFGQKSGFGTQSFGTASLGQTTSGQASNTPSSSGSPFSGSMFGGLGGKPTAEKANTNVFGTTTFGSSPSTSTASLFGNQGNQSFEGGKTGSTFGGGSFTGGGGSVAASGFGVTTQQSSSSGFGAQPSFGSPPAFGGGATFGATPTFGSGQTFGGSPFGSSGATFGNPPISGSGFTSPQTGGFSGFSGFGSSPTFEALAGSSNVPTFGSLSQGSGGGGFGSSPGFGGGGQTSGFGGTGFGSSQPSGFGTTTPPNNPSFTGYRS